MMERVRRARDRMVLRKLDLRTLDTLDTSLKRFDNFGLLALDQTVLPAVTKNLGQLRNNDLLSVAVKTWAPFLQHGLAPTSERRFSWGLCLTFEECFQTSRDLIDIVRKT